MIICEDESVEWFGVGRAKDTLRNGGWCGAPIEREEFKGGSVAQNAVNRERRKTATIVSIITG